MSNPAIDIPKDVWSKVATSVVTGFIHKVDHTPIYIQAFVDTGDAAPTLESEGVLAFEKSTIEPISSNNLIDVYLYPKKHAGKVRVDISFSSIGERSSIEAAITGADMWEGTATTIPVPPAIGEQMSVFSTDDKDGADDQSGVNSIRIEYLDGSGLQQTEDIVLNGTGSKDTIATDISFINDMYALTVGANGVAVGIIRAHKKGSVSTVYNRINLGGNKSLVSNRKIPSNKTFFITGWMASESKDKDTSFRLRANCTPDGNELVLFKRTQKLKGVTPFEAINPPIKICCNALVKVSAWTTGGAGSGSASFNGYLELNR